MSAFIVQTDSFAGTGIGTILDLSSSPMSNFSLQVASSGTPTVWTVNLEGSLDGSHYDTLVTHTNLVGLSGIITTSSAKGPVLYVRLRVTALTLLLAPSIQCIFVGQC